MTGKSAAEAAAQASHKVILRELARLSPSIPVLSRLGRAPPYSERREWNHLWLVDPLDGDAAFATGSESFSVNLALIEDGKPIYGVVYAPARHTGYYGRVGQRASRFVGDEPPIILNAGMKLNTTHTTPVAPSAEGSRALAICDAIEALPSEILFAPTMEWQTAAADAVLRAAGGRMCEPGSSEELVYNKPQLGNPALRIE